ncbi:protease [Aquimarina sp. AD10]|uniref:S41 family peptidase n=1 Tax=Aquimarina sp. AD10 TaxID=1714849 RepID=UPI000E4E6BCB|nr:S41 family peptidase [Aquimarina sp. AD10]AXT62225.1 protease [Aquimarina sp. AD10]RKM90580.1 protease [Aquimarina sp. AD10]
MKKLCFIIAIFVYIVSTAQGTQLLRQPTISDTEVVFVYANDLWKSSLQGGNAIRLTSNEGAEFSPHFSKDGKTIAFTAQYDGNTDVYTIPSGGGEPKRLTWHPGGDFVQGWTPEGTILFRSGRESHPTQTNKFYTVSPKGGLPLPFGIPRAGSGEVSPDGKHVAYVPFTSWDLEWRNYRGGQAFPIWIVNLETNNLTKTPQTTKERHLDPVWINNTVYYLSERDYVSNIWSYDIVSKTEKQITFHKKFDIKSLDAHNNKIIYEQGGYLHLIDLQNASTKQLEIQVQGDMNFARPRWENITASQLTNANISPTGKRAIFEHRGEIFSVPKENGTWRNLSNAPASAERAPIWSPKGDKIAWFSDASGEYKLVVTDQQGNNKKVFDLPNHTFYFRPDWSPDGSHIAYSDTDYNIWVINLTNGKANKVVSDNYAHPNRTLNPVWSPDSKWIAYPKQLKSHFKAIFAYNIDSKKTIQLTDGIADAISPIWDKTGKYLYFLASTNYGLQSGWLDMSSYDTEVERSLYAIVLSKSDKAPNLPKTDEEVLEKTSAEKDEPKEKDDSKNVVTVTIDADGIYNRIVALKLEARQYAGLAKGPDNVIFIAENVPNEPELTIHKYTIKDMKSEVFAKGVSDMITSSDRKNTLLHQKDSWRIVSTSAKPKPGDGKLKMNLKVKVNPTEEYHQIFKEGWRYMRDFLYVNNTHGAPWDEIYKWYSPWIKHVRHRTDLNYVVDIMSGEISIGHSYVSGGDTPKIDRIPVGLLGCDFEVNNGAYRITKIYSGESWNPDLEAPLSLPGIDVKEGDYILSINHQKLDLSINPYSLLEQTSGRETTLTVSSSPSSTNTREILVKPIRSERGLRTYDWIEANKRKVDKLSGGKLAYVYVPNTAGPGFTSFNRYYFSQQDKKGVIIDERNNGGGSAADYMIDIMSRELLGYFNSKTHDNRPWTTPIAGIWGPKVMLINERAGSGGDLLPYMFRAKKIGPLVGTRTWGGLVGTWDTPRFIDGGRMVAPRGGFYDVNGNWAVEGEGVAPDIEVIQDPKSVLQGKDPQLEKGVEEAMRLLKTQEFKIKAEPTAPIRWKRPEGYQTDN